MRHIRLDITGSTNLDARNFAKDADFGPLWITAAQQDAGRGRNGRNWVSPKGNFYGSHLFPTEVEPNRRGLYSFVAALAVHDALSELHPAGNFDLKWPNDILLDGAKIAGLLLETGQTHHQAWIVAGIGVNLNSHPSDTPYPATHLSGPLGEDIGPVHFLKVLSKYFDLWRDKFEQAGFFPIRDAWLSRASKIPGKVTVRLPNESFNGEALDLGENGALHVRLSNGTIRQVHAGDVFPG